MAARYLTPKERDAEVVEIKSQLEEWKVREEAFIGDVTYGKTRWQKMHSTGAKRVSAVAQTEWVERTVPELAILSRDLLDRVRELKAKRATRSRKVREPRGRKLLAGFLEASPRSSTRAGSSA